MKLGDIKMPLIRKLTTVGAARGLTLPRDWIENAEQEAGKKIVALALEVNGKITISPVFQENQQNGENQNGGNMEKNRRNGP